LYSTCGAKQIVITNILSKTGRKKELLEGKIGGKKGK